MLMERHLDGASPKFKTVKFSPHFADRPNLDLNSPKKQKTKESHRYTTPSARSSNVTQNMISPNFIPIEERAVFGDRRPSDNNGKIRANFKSVALRSPKLNNLTFHSPRKSSRNVLIQVQPLSPQQ